MQSLRPSWFERQDFTVQVMGRRAQVNIADLRQRSDEVVGRIDALLVDEPLQVDGEQIRVAPQPVALDNDAAMDRLGAFRRAARTAAPFANDDFAKRIQQARDVIAKRQQ